MVHGLVYSPWIDTKGEKPKITRAFRAESIADASPASLKSAQAA